MGAGEMHALRRRRWAADYEDREKRLQVVTDAHLSTALSERGRDEEERSESGKSKW